MTVSIHEDVERDETAYYKDAETVFRAHGGRPHWGKVHYLSGEDLAADYDHWQDWWRVRDEVDPTGVLLNDALRKLRTS